MIKQLSLKPGFHLQQATRPLHKKSDYVVEHSSFLLVALFGSNLVVVVVETDFMETRLWVSIKPGFHYTTNPTTTTQKQSDYEVEQSSGLQAYSKENIR